jgi:hypothetical protein
MMRRRWLWLAILMLLLTIVSACQPGETALSFDTIEQRDVSGTGKMMEGPNPVIFVVANADRADKLKGLITAEAQAKLQNLDYDKYVAVAVFQGKKSSTGYSIQIDRIVRTGDHVRVYPKFTEPRPDESTGAMLTSPYHLVQVRKIEDWRSSMLFYLIVNGVVEDNDVGVFNLSVATYEPETPAREPGQSPLVPPTLSSPLGPPVK